jgi:hypothetical protein
MNNYWTTLEYDECNLLFSMDFVDMASRVCNMWKYKRAVKYMKNKLLGNFSKKMF